VRMGLELLALQIYACWLLSARCGWWCNASFPHSKTHPCRRPSSCRSARRRFSNGRLLPRNAMTYHGLDASRKQTSQAGFPALQQIDMALPLAGVLSHMSSSAEFMISQHTSGLINTHRTPRVYLQPIRLFIYDSSTPPTHLTAWKLHNPSLVELPFSFPPCIDTRPTRTQRIRPPPPTGTPAPALPSAPLRTPTRTGQRSQTLQSDGEFRTG
jgi:hypothetical protein